MAKLGHLHFSRVFSKTFLDRSPIVADVSGGISQHGYDTALCWWQVLPGDFLVTYHDIIDGLWACRDMRKPNIRSAEAFHI